MPAKKDKYPPFPVRPGDVVYLPGKSDSPEGAARTVTAVGATEDGDLIVRFRKVRKPGDTTIYIEFPIYRVGSDVFLTEKDAEEYARNPEAFKKPSIDWDELKLPVEPGQTYYFCDYDPFFHRWQLIEDYYTYVLYDADGGILVGNGGFEFNLTLDPCFNTARKARAYVKKNWLAGDEWKP